MTTLHNRMGIRLRTDGSENELGSGEGQHCTPHLSPSLRRLAWPSARHGLGVVGWITPRVKRPGGRPTGQDSQHRDVNA